MKRLDEQLNRLLKSAASAPRQAAGEPSFTLESRVLGKWRGARAEDESEFLVVWFRRATICACMLAAASLAWTFTGHADESGAVAVADSAMRMGVEP
jgi:hypothetical protein